MTSRIVSLVACFSLLLSTGVNAQLLSKSSAANDSQAEFSKRIPARQASMGASVREAEAVGWNIYRYETLTDLAGYVLAAQTSPEQRADIRGSVVVPGEQWHVRFYSKDASGACIPAGDVVFSDPNQQSYLPGTAVGAFTDAELALIKAAELVQGSKKDPCEGLYRVVAVPAPTGNAIWVYQLRDCLEANRLPEGQHVRYEVSADGSSITAQREFARRCNVLATQTVAGSQQEDINFSNAMDPQPTELHVYLSLRYGVNIYVATTQSNQYWHITKGIIRAD